MKASIHTLTDEITYAIGPIFQAKSDYTEILPAMCLVMAKVILSTPDKGREQYAYDYAMQTIKGSLDQMIELEAQANVKKENFKEELDKRINGFDQFAKSYEGEFRDESGNLTEVGFENLKKKIIQLHTPDKEETNTSSFAPEASEKASQEAEP